MMLRLQKVALVFNKDWLEIRRNWQVLFPLLLIPVVFAVMLPLMIVGPTLRLPPQSSAYGLQTVLKSLPAQVKDEISGMTGQQAIMYIVSIYLFAPIFLVIPIMGSSIIASDSFAGEKERRTLEALLATPLSDSEMLLGKMLVSFAPAVAATTAAFIIYSVVIDYFTLGLFGGRLLFPNMTWLALIFGVAPTLAFANIGLTVLISARAKGVREAQQISALLLVPLIGIVLGQISGALLLNRWLAIAMGAALAVIDLVIFVASLKAFGRDHMLARLS
jgi:ABC-2 type transport system permease protein